MISFISRVAATPTPRIEPAWDAIVEGELSCHRVQGPVSRKSRNFSGAFRVAQFSVYLQNEGVSRHETLQLFSLLFPLELMRRPALQNKRVGVLRMAYRARKVFGTFEKRAPAFTLSWRSTKIIDWAHLTYRVSQVSTFVIDSIIQWARASLLSRLEESMTKDSEMNCLRIFRATPW